MTGSFWANQSQHGDLGAGQEQKWRKTKNGGTGNLQMNKKWKPPATIVG